MKTSGARCIFLFIIILYSNIKKAKNIQLLAHGMMILSPSVTLNSMFFRYTNDADRHRETD